MRLFSRPSLPPAKFLEGRVGYAVGDVHGCSDLLAVMLDTIEERAAGEQRESGPPIVVFLGDYVDRGPNSAGVLDLLLSERPSNCERRYLRGNHEQAMVAFMEAPLPNRRWVLHGGAETMMSYGVAPPSLAGASDEDWGAAAAALREKVPAAHLEFLGGLERYVELGGYAFVHAGVDAGMALTDQPDEVLYWTRAPFIADRRPFSHVVVHGHTPAERPYKDKRRVGVDTGAYASGALTAARFEGDEVTFFSVKAERRRRPEPEASAVLDIQF
ncbi:MAG: serine/threonine protein phosphatase [Proteobacteria bacterium]|nr:serine/threonine protein phosphatase [Pseudomonadota bacterium]